MPKSQKPDEDRLHEMIERRDDLKQQLAQLQGERKQVLEQLSSLGAKNVEQGKKLLKEAEEEIEELKESLQQLLSKLETEYNWE